MPKAPENDAPAVEAVKAEALARKLEDGSTVVPLVTDEGTADIAVAPPARWYEGAVEHLTAGRISEWVKLAAADEESLVRWQGFRKRYCDLDAFLARWVAATGETPGESKGSSSS
jgi:hypothetical protein